MNLGKVKKNIGYSVSALGGTKLAAEISNAGTVIGNGTRLSIPLGGSMSDFEKAVFKDGRGIPLVNFIFSFDSVLPWDIAQSAVTQLAGFADLINDINESEDFSEYFSGAWDFIKQMGAGFYKDGKMFDSSKYGFSIFFDPGDTILPDVAEDTYSMSLKNQLTYSLSASRVRKYASKFWFDEGRNSLEVIL